MSAALSSAPMSTSPRPERAPEPMCGVCPHPLSHHDAISLRFCRATETSSLDRGCVCPPD